MKNLINLLILVTAVLFSQITEAQTTTGQEAKAKSDTLKAGLQKGQLLAKEGKTLEASLIYTRLMKSHPSNLEPVQGWLMANMKREPGGEEAAIKQLEELEKQFPENTGIIFFKAFIEAEYGHNEEAIGDFNRLIKIQPDTALNYIGKGQVLYEMGKYPESFEAFERATTLDPKRFDVWSMKAGALAKMGRFDEAIASANKGLDIFPNYPAGIYNRACFYCLKGDKGNALADLAKAITMNPGFRENARKDEDFKTLFEDDDFKKLTADN